MDNLPALWIVLTAFLLAGTVKGVAGVGLPMTVLGVLTFFTDPRTAFATALVPIFLANGLQLYRAGGVLGAVRRYLPFLVCMMVGIPLVLTLTADASERFLLGVIGVVVLLFVGLNVSPYVPRIADSHDRAGQIALGSAAGVLGGMTSIWLPAILIYLTARNTPKDEFVRATGLLLVSGSIPLFAGFAREGILTGPIALVSLAMMIPTAIGLLAGERVRNRLSEATFRRVVLFMFFLIGLNMIRRSVVG
ncbi:MAG: sulfite exporter TauE/SafE family protein [Silicimonas sp.]|nr:sulfite exporter TauE/SafE family protein [Silicimonas sp.]NNF73529.1 sulfite exporter TauE/SafE family protein [Paracoccaceae bacterium]